MQTGDQPGSPTISCVDRATLRFHESWIRARTAALGLIGLAKTEADILQSDKGEKQEPQRAAGALTLWWRWGESNPRPEPAIGHLLHA